MLAAWRESGLPLGTFARRRGMTAERLRWWRKRLGDRGETSEVPRLVPAVVTGLAPASSAAVVVTLRAPGDVVVEIADAGAVPAAWLSALVSGSASCASPRSWSRS